MKTPFFSFALGTTLSFLLLPQGAAAVRLLLMWQKYAIGLGPKSNLRSLFILCFLFHSSFQDDSPPRLALSLTLTPLTASHQRLHLNILNLMV